MEMTKQVVDHTDHTDITCGHCDFCGSYIERFRGQMHIYCPDCDAEYNSFGQRLRSGWADNQSNYDGDISDLEGFEAAQLAAELD